MARATSDENLFPETSDSVAPTEAPGAPRRAAALPDGWTLLHIGPPKTGTTALQDAASSRRSALARLGVLYPGRTQNHREAALDLLGRATAWASADAPRSSRADAILSEIAAGDHRRVFLSAETFGMGTHGEARRALARLGDNVHVLIGLRNMHGYALSMWQQRIKNGSPESLDEWLKAATRTPGRLGFPGIDVFFERDGFDFVSRWVDLVGPERVTVVIPDRDRRMLFDVAEDLLDLPRHTLAAHESNASLSAVESELLRQCSTGALNAGVSKRDLRRLTLNGISHSLVRNRQAHDGERRTLLPAAYVAPITDYGKRLADAIDAAQLDVIGDTSVIWREPTRVAHHPPQPDLDVPRDLATAVFQGVLRKLAPPPPSTPSADVPVAPQDPPKAPAAWALRAVDRLRGAPRARLDWVVVGGHVADDVAWTGDSPLTLMEREGEPRITWLPPAAQTFAGRDLRGHTRVLLLVPDAVTALLAEWRRRASAGDPISLETLALEATRSDATGLVTTSTLAHWCAAVGARNVTVAFTGEEEPGPLADRVLGRDAGWFDAARAKHAPSRRLLSAGEASVFAEFADIAPRTRDSRDVGARRVLLDSIDAVLDGPPSARWVTSSAPAAVTAAAREVTESLTGALASSRCTVIGKPTPLAPATSNDADPDAVPSDFAVRSLTAALVAAARAHRGEG